MLGPVQTLSLVALVCKRRSDRYQAEDVERVNQRPDRGWRGRGAVCPDNVHRTRRVARARHLAAKAGESGLDRGVDARFKIRSLIDPIADEASGARAGACRPERTGRQIGAVRDVAVGPHPKRLRLALVGLDPPGLWSDG